jgi:hypothetical protein
VLCHWRQVPQLSNPSSRVAMLVSRSEYGEVVGLLLRGSAQDRRLRAPPSALRGSCDAPGGRRPCSGRSRNWTPATPKGAGRPSPGQRDRGRCSRYPPFLPTHVAAGSTIDGATPLGSDNSPPKAAWMRLETALRPQDRFGEAASPLTARASQRPNGC